MHKIQKFLEKNLTKTIKQKRNTIIRSMSLNDLLLAIRFFLKMKNLCSICSSLKFNNKFVDLFIISDIIKTQVYYLWLSLIYRFIHSVFHVSLLKFYHCCEDEKFSDHSIIIENEEEWNVKAIHADRIHRRKQQFLIKWESFSKNENTWKLIEHLNYVREMLTKYQMKKERLSTQN